MNTIDDIGIELSIVLGTTSMPVHQLLRMGRGAVIELDATEDDDVTILANNMLVARGQLVVEGETIGVSITEMTQRVAGK